jgi:hypothetical protein
MEVKFSNYFAFESIPDLALKLTPKPDLDLKKIILGPQHWHLGTGPKGKVNRVDSNVLVAILGTTDI